MSAECCPSCAEAIAELDAQAAAHMSAANALQARLDAFLAAQGDS